MIKRSYKDLEPYFPPGHFGVTCKRYHGKDETNAEKFWIGISEFEPGGGADWAYDDNPLEKVYFVLEGEMTITDKDGNKRRATEIVADNVYFADSKTESTPAAPSQNAAAFAYPAPGYSAPAYGATAYPMQGYAAPTNPASDFQMLEDDDAQLPF